MLTQEELKRLMEYDPDTGVFRWKVALSNKGPVGRAVGSPDKHGYIVTGIRRRQYKTHRLAWLYMTGAWPDGSIDHINGVCSDNRWCNLRDVSHEVNCQNKRKPRLGSRTGFMGVTHRDGLSKPYKATITVHYKIHCLGYYATPEEANAVYIEARRKMHMGNTL